VTLIDISVPIRTAMPIYEGNPGVALERVLSILDGETANVSRLDLGVDRRRPGAGSTPHALRGARGASRRARGPWPARHRS
jgi:hypothetical protein